MGQLVLEHLTKIFHQNHGEPVRALDQADLTVEDKELLVVAGPSGCGKTTLLRLIAGLETPTAGKIKMDDVVLNDLAPKERDVAMVFQNPALYPHMSAYENMAFGLTIRRYSKAEINRRVTEAAELLGLVSCLERKPMELSGGERQRVALGRAFVRRPKILLLDEPLSNLDAPLRSQMRLEITKLHKEFGATFIYVTHDQVEAMTLGQRVTVLETGRIRQVAEPHRLYQHPNELFVARFFGFPPMNIFPGCLVEKEGKLWFTAEDPEKGDLVQRDRLVVEVGNTLKSYVDKRVYLGLRPENIAPKCDSNPANGRVFEALIQNVEHLGAESHLHLSAGGHSLVIRSFMQQQPKIGQTLLLCFDMTRAHFFDASSGKRIGDETV
jgi:multiple sugar transport system ATP-binding protein